MITPRKARLISRRNKDDYLATLIDAADEIIQLAALRGEYSATLYFYSQESLGQKTNLLNHLKHVGYNVTDKDNHLLVDWVDT